MDFNQSTLLTWLLINLFYVKLLRCTNQNHMDHDLPVRFDYHLYNRNLAACSNMLQILFSVRTGNGIPAWFRRQQQQQQ